MIRKSSNANLGKRTRRIIATATALTFFCQNFAWAVCADGSTFPANGFVAGQPPAANWSPGVFTGAAESIFIPDNSVFEHNDPTQPSTGGGHNWVFDQGTTLCKETDTGPAGGTPTAWAIPLNDPDACIFLPVIKNGQVIARTDIPYQGQAITPTCDPTLLSQPGAPNPANTRLNQLGCALVKAFTGTVQATTPQTAPTYLFVAGAHGGLFAFPLINDNIPSISGKFGGGSFEYFADIPEGQKLTNAAVSPDGMFAVATSIQRQSFVYACLNPLGDPGDPSLPIDPNFLLPVGASVKCMQVGGHGLQVDLTTAFGPDNQPYFGGQSVVNTFNQIPGGSAATAWPQCIFNGFSFANPPPTTLMGKLQAVFNAHSANHCGNAVPNGSFLAASISQPAAIISHGQYMYASTTATFVGQPAGSTVVQFKVTVDPVSGLSQYRFRGYAADLPSLLTGIGVADDLKSVMVYGETNGLDFVTVKLPLCEDM